MTAYYLSGTLTGLSAAEARDIAFNRAPAIARPQDPADWYVAYLVSGPLQPGQQPFDLTDSEREFIRDADPDSVQPLSSGSGNATHRSERGKTVRRPSTDPR